MSQLITHHYEKLLLATASGVVFAGCAWVWQAQPALQAVRSEPEQPVFTGEAPPRLEPGLPLTKHRWTSPSAQSEGADWRYEVFTPPVIYYNAAARSFAVTPPQYAAEATETVFGLELLAVKRAPYRLQLAGYIGAPGDYLAAFVSSEVPQTLLVRPGRRLEPLGLTLQRFDVRKIAIESDAPGPVYDIAAQAVLLDEQTGAEVLLDSRETKFTDTPLAVFQAPDGKGPARELQAGDSFSDSDATYRIERIQLDPPEVIVARSTPGLAVPETRILRPSGPTPEHMAARPKPLVAPATRGVAAHGQ
ncbi:hypothetical protein Verru16b_02646 [Lacunisphaera limnophila]|uniref:Uncharacterized protein n=1 Tax=Lacunisphaera limnophila TaxID=1838286 RepID=A0A1D8AXF5_9BACT|nr:hypothetical protein [Lacunisphaera limnophila]AOS45563.1 hypothetical protein Verru16b_02646 [Lacunisphaera limnophila]